MRAGSALQTDGLVHVGAVAALLGGALRIVSTFIPYQPNAPALEALYGFIDLALMFGLIGVYLVHAPAVGRFGLAGFLAGLTGVASIVGPDSAAFGIDFYRIGALVFVIGLACLSLQFLRARAMILSAWLWLLTFLASCASAILPQAFIAAGLCLGGGYIAAGLELMRRR